MSKILIQISTASKGDGASSIFIYYIVSVLLVFLFMFASYYFFFLSLFLIVCRYVADYVSGMIQNFEKKKSEKPIFMWSNFIDAHEPERMHLTYTLLFPSITLILQSGQQR